MTFSFTSISLSLFKTKYSQQKISYHTLPSHLKVLYESDNVIAIDKPENISHHDDETEEGIIGYVRKLQQEGRFSYSGRIYGVHRLDRVTSGILLLAKSNEVAGSLSQLFKNKEVTKYYVALTSKKPKMKKQGWVKGDMVTSRRKSWKLTMAQSNPAITRFYTAGLGNCKLDGWYGEDSPSESSDLISLRPLPKTAILFEPHTGKTHQLRVAAKSLGLSILGDPIYSDGTEYKSSKRTFLHALALHVALGDEDIAIYNPPSSWYKNGIEANENGIGDVVDELMKKYCKNSKILSLL